MTLEEKIKAIRQDKELALYLLQTEQEITPRSYGFDFIKKENAVGLKIREISPAQTVCL